MRGSGLCVADTQRRLDRLLVERAHHQLHAGHRRHFLRLLVDAVLAGGDFGIGHLLDADHDVHRRSLNGNVGGHNAVEMLALVVPRYLRLHAARFVGWRAP